MSATPRGRRPGNQQTRREILAAAQRAFESRGFESASVRAIARDAGVDPALVRHYFPDKAALLMAALEVSVDPRRVLARVLEGDRSTLGPRLVSALLSVWETPMRRDLIAVIRGRPEMFQDFTTVVSHQALSMLTEHLHLSRTEAQDRAAVIAALVSGMFVTRCLAQMEPIASMTRAQVVSIFGPLMQQAIDGGHPR